MKKVFSVLALAAVVIGLQSCKKDCIECTTAGIKTTVCENDYNDNGTGVTWSQYKSTMLASPNCKEK